MTLHNHLDERVNVCLFCQNPDAKVTAEHTLSKPIGDLLNTTNVRFFHWTVDTNGVQRREPYKGDRVSYKRRAYCAECNNGWMQRMDLDILPLLTPMVTGDSIVLNPKDQFDLAIWATKIGLVYESLYGNDRVVPDEIYKWFYDNRLPRPDGPVQLVRYVDAEPHIHIRKQYGWRSGRDLEMVSFECVVLAIVIGQYAAITALPAQPRLVFKLPKDPSRLDIWPFNTEQLNWPPLGHYVADSLPDLVEVDVRPS